MGSSIDLQAVLIQSGAAKFIGCNTSAACNSQPMALSEWKPLLAALSFCPAHFDHAHNTTHDYMQQLCRRLAGCCWGVVGQASEEGCCGVPGRQARL
jgi:hypothetical protein